MTNKDVFKILLCSYGYDRNIKIETYHGDSLDIGYDIYAENKEGDCYEEINCEGFMFHVFKILEYMKDSKANFKTNWWNCSPKYVLDETQRNKRIAAWDKHDKEIEQSIIDMQPFLKWSEENDPCIDCKINKHDHWDDIHHNCELNHNHSCKLLLKFNEDSTAAMFKLNKSTDASI
jgi:hypothetical protein